MTLANFSSQTGVYQTEVTKVLEGHRNDNVMEKDVISQVNDGVNDFELFTF